jgi:hypothetical protein
MSGDTADNIAEDFAAHLFREALATHSDYLVIDTGGFDLESV